MARPPRAPARTTTTPVTPRNEPADELEALITSWQRRLKNEGKSPLTVRSYIDGVKQLHRYLKAQGMPLTIQGITGEHLETWLVALRETHQPATVATRHQVLVAFFKWLVAEDEIRRSPMERIPRPRLIDKPVPVISLDDFAKLIQACSARDFASVRDKTILMTLFEVGLRRAEIAGLTIHDIDLDAKSATVTGKRSKTRIVSFSDHLVDQLDRYLRARRAYLETHRRPPTDRLWIGETGRTFTQYGIEHAVRRRAINAGLVDEQGRPTIHPHTFRHSACHYLLASGMDPAAVMAQFGWDSSDMLTRYGVSMARARAAAGYEKHSPLAQLVRRQ